MSKIKNITLEFLCAEKIDNQLFCAKCAHTLTDFTQRTNANLSDEIKRSKGAVCGLFKKSQLSDQFLRYAAATVMAASATLPAIGQTATAALPTSLANECNGVVPVSDDRYFQGIVVSRQAEPIGGFDKFYEDLYKAIHLPPDIRINGKVILGISIDEFGKVMEYRVVKGVDKRVDEEVIRAVKSLNYSFTPGRQKETPIPVRLVIPVIIDTEKKE